MKTVRDIMATDIITIAPNALIEHAIELMLEHRVSGLPVVDDEGRLVGVISEYDGLKLVQESEADYWPVEPVVCFMSKYIRSIDASVCLEDLAVAFQDSSVRRLPVVEQGKLVGIVSRRDVMRAVLEERKRATTHAL